MFAPLFHNAFQVDLTNQYLKMVNFTDILIAILGDNEVKIMQ